MPGLKVKIIKRIMLLVFFFPFSYQVAAESNNQVKNQIQVGGTVDTGNNSALTLLGRFKSELNVDYPNQRWGYVFSVLGKKASARSVDTARLFDSNLEGRYLLSPKFYSFLKVIYIYNAFDAYDLTTRTSGGFGWIALKDNFQTLTIEAGPGGTFQRVAGGREWEQQLIGHIETSYKRKFAESAIFEENVTVDMGALNTITQSKTSLKNKITEKLAFQVSIDLNHNSNIPPNSTNTRKTDTSTNFTLIYDF